MKQIILFLLVASTLLVSNKTLAQQQESTFTTNGNQILDPCGEVFIPRGVNYALLDDWEFPDNLNSGELSAQIIQANPNTVRIQWYRDYGQPNRPAYSLSDLDSVISRFERAGIVSILEMHDVTCTDNYQGFMELVQYWTSFPMVDLIQKHQKSMMINIANEYGQVEWSNNPNTAYTEWVDDYENAIDAIRQAGIKVPIIIDAPDCGISISRLLDAASDFYTEDSLHNIILSDHAYYYGNTATMMADLANQAANAPVPVIFGEIANIQDANGPCSNNITHYPALLQACQTKNEGWLAWVWTDDVCNERRISSNGYFSNLTNYGSDIVNNANYGLAVHAQKACFSTDTSTAIHAINSSQTSLQIYPNPSHRFITIKFPAGQNTFLSIWNVAGQQLRSVPLKISNGAATLDFQKLPSGMYWLKIRNNQFCRWKKVIKY